ncbi:thermonuclease family protein [Candidatus Nomurabacteria bacterium]|nr:thermonuclease family protein [Candidatus Nomurabacteria bacterium]MCB9819405.1 thermonuclease family protein [Candidatus Nomurabacteria bacterium]
MKIKGISAVLSIIFTITLIAGLLSPREAEELLEKSAEIILEENVEEEEIMDSLFEDQKQITKTQSASVADAIVGERVLYPVVRVIDGDTIVIEKDGVNETVRLIGIDTPETVHPSKPVQCFGKEASDQTRAWLQGENVYIEIDSQEGTRDKYGRMLGYVLRADGYFINLELIRQGFAYEYTYNLPYQYQAEFMEAEKKAKEGERGLWADGVCL